MASNRIRGITIEIGGDTTKLNSALKSVDTQLSKTQRELNDVNKLLQFDGSKLGAGNVELLKQKQSLLSNEISTTKQRLDELKNAQSSVAQGTSEWDALQREIIATEQNLKSLEDEYKSFGSVGAQQVKLVGEKLQEVGAKMEATGKTLTTYVTLPLVGVGTAAVTSFADVDKTMTLVNATMSNTTEEASLLSDAMKDAAANSTFGMSDAAEATLNFARAGLDAQEAADALAPAMNLAAAAGGDLDTVSAGLVATINGFGDSFDETTRYADVFANACNNSALDVNSLSESMSIAAPIFSAAGYSIEDAALYMGIMANAGIDANVAATSLKTGFARLVAPTAEAKKALDDLGVSVVNADGTMKDTTTIQNDLNQAFAGLTESEQLAAAEAIFGKNQMSSWLALINTAPEDVNSLASALETEGTTASQAEAMMSGFGGSLEKLKSSVDVAGASLGEALAPTISKVADGLQAAVDWFNELDPDMQTTVANVGLLVAAIGPVLLVGGKLINGFGTIMTYAPLIQGAMTTAATFMTGTLLPTIGSLIASLAGVIVPLLPIIAVVAAVIAVGVLLYKNWDTIKEKAGELKDFLGEKFGQMKEAVGNKLGDMASAAKTKGAEIKTNLGNAMEQAKNAVSEKINAAKKWGSDLVGNIADGIKSGITKVKNAVKDIADTIKSYLHFSEPDVGPLSDFHTYMPDMIKMITTGIDDGIPKVENATDRLASAMTPQTTTTYNAGGFNINVYATDNQQAQDIVDIIEERINRNITQQNAVWGMA